MTNDEFLAPTDSLQALIEAVNAATEPRAAAGLAAFWIGKHLGPAVIGLLNPQSGGLEAVVSPDFEPEPQIMEWMQSASNWLAWETWPLVRRLDDEHPIDGLTGAAWLIPLRCEERLYGLLWLQAEMDDRVLLLGQLLAARVHLLLGQGGWSGVLEDVNEFSRVLAQQLGSDDLWNPVHDQIQLLFDTASFFVALHDEERNHLIFPIVSEDGMLVDAHVRLERSGHHLRQTALFP
jgi:hypothetical protein